MTKGKRREREAVELYEAAGYTTETPNRTGSQWNTGGLDFFGLFDFIAMPTDGAQAVWGQVKSNNVRYINDWFTEAYELLPPFNRIHYLVAHDNHGWRLAAYDPPKRDYYWAVDEREMDCAMGEGMKAYLEDFEVDHE